MRRCWAITGFLRRLSLYRHNARWRLILPSSLFPLIRSLKAASGGYCPPWVVREQWRSDPPNCTKRHVSSNWSTGSSHRTARQSQRRSTPIEIGDEYPHYRTLPLMYVFSRLTLTCLALHCRQPSLDFLCPKRGIVVFLFPRFDPCRESRCGPKYRTRQSGASRMISSIWLGMRIRVRSRRGQAVTQRGEKVIVKANPSGKKKHYEVGCLFVLEGVRIGASRVRSHPGSTARKNMRRGLVVR